MGYYYVRKYKTNKPKIFFIDLHSEENNTTTFLIPPQKANEKNSVLILLCLQIAINYFLVLIWLNNKNKREKMIRRAVNYVSGPLILLLSSLFLLNQRKKIFSVTHNLFIFLKNNRISLIKKSYN